MKNIAVEVPTLIQRNVKFGRKLFATSYNRETGEVVVKVDGLKLMEQPEEKQYKATVMYYYWEAVVDLHNYVHIKFGGTVDCAPIKREVNAMQVRINARGAQLLAKHTDQ